VRRRSSFGLVIAIEAAVVAVRNNARRLDMATIGSFKKVGNDFQGEIVTLSLQAKGVRIVAEPNRSNDNAPSHRIYVRRAEIGQPGRSAPRKVATTSRSSSTTPRSTRRSTPTCSMTKTAKATPCYGRGRARAPTETLSQAPPGVAGRVSLMQRIAKTSHPAASSQQSERRTAAWRQKLAPLRVARLHEPVSASDAFDRGAEKGEPGDRFCSAWRLPLSAA
jgi:hypothetical protein